MEVKFTRFLSIVITLSLTACVSDAPNVNYIDPLTSQVIQPAQIIPNFDQTTKVADFTIAGKPFELANLASNASGITWDPYNQQYFVVQNNAARIYRYDAFFAYIGLLEKSGNINNDTEGLTYFDGSHLFLVTEANIAYKIRINNDVFNRGFYGAVAKFSLGLPPQVKNKGFEGIAYRPPTTQRKARVYTGQEGSARSSLARMKVVYFELDDSGKKIVEPFDAEVKFGGIITDIAGMTFDPTGSSLLILSQESKKIIQVNPETGELISQLRLTGAPIYEGITIGPNGELVVVGEKNWVQIFRRPEQH